MSPFQIYPLKIPTIGSLFFRSRRFSLHLQLWNGLLATVLSWVFAHYSSLPSRPCASWPCYVPIFCTECGVHIVGLSFFSFFPFHLPISLFFFSAFLKINQAWLCSLRNHQKRTIRTPLDWRIRMLALVSSSIKCVCHFSLLKFVLWNNMDKSWTCFWRYKTPLHIFKYLYLFSPNVAIMKSGIRPRKMFWELAVV